MQGLNINIQTAGDDRKSVDCMPTFLIFYVVYY